MPFPLQVIDLGRRAYEPVLALQERLVEQRRQDEIPDTLLLVEHEPVYTLGRNACERHVLASAEELTHRGIRVIRTTRGGDVTYHGPGQLVGYPILDLRARGEGVLTHVGSLEKAIVRLLDGFGVAGATDRKNRGVWVGNDKIAALGVRVTRQVTMHGFALNVKMDLAPYRSIVPCGIEGRGVTSLHLFVPDVRAEDVRQRMIRCFCEVFGYAIWTKDPQSLIG